MSHTRQREDGGTGHGMLTLGEIDALERRLRASIITLKEKNIQDVTLVEAIDKAELWPVAFENLKPIAPRDDFNDLIRRAPLFVCAAAAEIGFRFEGIGTTYWAKLAESLGVRISLIERGSIAAVFNELASKYGISKPSNSAFSAHFSIISWPIANALLPVELIGPVSRLLARAPISALPSSGQLTNFPRLRAWANTAEGARLTDWLRFEAPTSRVLAALLTDNAKSVLPDASYRRLRNELAKNTEAFLASRAARFRARTLKSAASSESSLGWLTLLHDKSGVRMFANWPPLPAGLLDEARATARSGGWRPRLWGTGGFLHPDTALSAGPFALGLQTVPTDDCPVYQDAAKIFGGGSEVAEALTARRIRWNHYLLFDPDQDRTQAEQRFDYPNGMTGLVWIATKASLNGLRLLGNACGYTVYEANLSEADHRAILFREGLLSRESRSMLARHPLDAIGARPGVVRPERPFLLYKTDSALDEARPQRLPAGAKIAEIAGPSGRPGIRAEIVPPFDENVVELVLLERDAVFEALTERRLDLRVESLFPLTNVPVTAELEISGLLIARGRDSLSSVPATVSAASALLKPLYEDRVLTKLLEAGRGTLRISIGRSTAIQISLERPMASVEWVNGMPSLRDADFQTELVSATARHPNRFARAVSIETPLSGAVAFGLKFADGNIADPVHLFTSSTFNLDDLVAHFGTDIGSRRMYDDGGGVADIAHARIAWARGLCTNLTSIAAKTRIVRQFEEPLVIDLCGRSWWLAEQTTRTNPTDPHDALWQVALKHGLASIPTYTTASEQVLFARAFRQHARRLDPDWPLADFPNDMAMDNALNAAFTDAVRELHSRGKLLDVDEDDCDFGNLAEEWKCAADDALSLVRRTSLVQLIPPLEGGRQLSRRSYANVSLAELAEDLASWTEKWALPRGQLNPDAAASALQLWLSPAACCELDPLLRVLTADPFVSRAVRYAALRLHSETIESRA